MPSVPSTSRPDQPILALTCGDSAGIGPEVVLAAWAATPAHAKARLRVVADPHLLARLVAEIPALPRLEIVAVAPQDQRPSTPDTVLVIPPDAPAEDVLRGQISAAGGRSALAALRTAHALLRRTRATAAPAHGGWIDALVTGPLHKEALHAAGEQVPGHTEWLARACGLPDSAASMMLWLPAAAAGPAAGLGVVHATLHEALASALEHLSTERIVQAGLRLASLLEALLQRPPRIAVAALNPHGGEGGLFGDEETRLILPAVTALAAAGIDVAGPLPADTLFLRASRGAFDGIVAQYHDQGHIPIKLLGMHRAVNITLGLPLVRTSVAHGTAFDIVGTGQADPASMLAAIEAARCLVHCADQATSSATLLARQLEVGSGLRAATGPPG